MEKLPNFVINGGVKMPVGYRFHPTDEELVIHYLKRKVHAAPLPASIIPDFDVFHTHPWGLPGCGGDVREKRYFFYNKINANEIDDSKRAAGCGYWKPMGKEKQIVDPESSEAVGIRKTLVFSQRKRRYHETQTKTRWLMHEYQLLSSQVNPTHTQASKMELGNWVVYRVFQRKRKPQRSSDIIPQPSNSKRTRTQRLVEVITPSSSSSCSSDITHLSSNANRLDHDQEETSSAAADN
ncbi:unnamed protein product [Prunus armeniaca]|uniref:NAC domain-containing protein n=1 Tax=Prunus armeniaca TaxID=36596 RepID=A0A6J5X0Z9_PRUAR|nr:unnamed protein product [Prunus armeniaca]